MLFPLSPIVRLSIRIEYLTSQGDGDSPDENRTCAGVERHPFTKRSACSKDTFTFSVLAETLLTDFQEEL
jgi:hypothetical protein